MDTIWQHAWSTGKTSACMSSKMLPDLQVPRNMRCWHGADVHMENKPESSAVLHHKLIECSHTIYVPLELP